MAQALLPRIEARADYTALRPESGLWLPPIRTICQRHGCATDGLVRLGDGTNVVFATGDGQVVKLFPPFWALEWQIDRAVAERVYGRLGVATPEIRACGELEGWPYLVMSRLSGRYLNQVWDELDSADQLQIASDLGELLARMHALPTEGLPHVAERWVALLRDQPAASVERHREKGVPEEWLVQIPAFLASAGPLAPAGAAPTLLSGDLHQYHLLANEERGRWRICGLFDFDGSLVGFHEYDFASPGLFMMAGSPELLRAFLRAYGYPDTKIDRSLSLRLMAYTLLDRYRGWALQEPTASRGCTTLEQLADAIYGFKAG
jgi:hygromycin-B 7''-O-kinase